MQKRLTSSTTLIHSSTSTLKHTTMKLSNDSPTDAELVADWQSGDSLAGGRLMKRHIGSIRGFFSAKVPGSPEDLVQQTMLACLESIGRYEGRSSFRVFLFGIARNVLYRHYRDANVAFDSLTSSALSPECDSSSSVSQTSDSESSDSLLYVLRSLPPTTQRLVALAYWEKLSDHELSKVVGVPVGTIKSRLRKARREIGQGLERASTTGTSAPGDSAHHSLESWAAAIRTQGQPAHGSSRR